jgi:hypothetical protein
MQVEVGSDQRIQQTLRLLAPSQGSSLCGRFAEAMEGPRPSPHAARVLQETSKNRFVSWRPLYVSRVLARSLHARQKQPAL